MKYFIFELTMPNSGSWNGKWLGSDKNFYKTRAYRFRKNGKNIDVRLKNVMTTKGFYYDFEDKWGAYVKIREVSLKEKKHFDKITDGFCGYEWMIDEIEKYGRILTRKERHELIDEEL